MSVSQIPEFTRATAKRAGALYLAIAVVGGFSIGYVPSKIVVSNDAALTASNLLANLTLFSAGVFGDIVLIFMEIILTTMLFVMFRPVNQTLSVIAVSARIGMIVVMAGNLVLSVMPAAILTQAADFTGFPPAQLQSLAMVFFKAHDFGTFAWQVLFGAHLWALGLLLVKTPVVPAILGWGLFIGGFGYVVQAASKLMLVENQVVTAVYIGLLILVTLAELSFAIWLLMRGGRVVPASV